jgi:hypothetical protein
MATANPNPLDLDGSDPDAPSAADRAWWAEHANDPPAAVPDDGRAEPEHLEPFGGRPATGLDDADIGPQRGISD